MFCLASSYASLAHGVPIAKPVACAQQQTGGLAAGPLYIREAKTDITPNELLPLGGYTARHGEDMEPGGEPLFARCILFSRGSWNEALVSVEMLTVPDSLAEEVRKRIRSDVRLFLTATHTHSAPDSQLLNSRMTFKIPGVASFRHRWLAWYADKIASTVTAALAKPRVACESLQVQEFTADLNRGRRPGADPEQIGTGLAMIRNGFLNRLFLSYPAHPVFYGSDHNQTSGDWPGKLSHDFEPAYEPWLLLVLTGAIGDVSPKAPGNSDAERIDNFCASLTKAWESTRRIHIAWRDSQPTGSVDQPIVMDPPKPSPAFIHDYKAPEALAWTMVQKFAPDHASITALRFGDFAIVGVPGEPTSHLGRRIRAAGLAMGFRSVLVVSHVNGWIGYILDPVDYSHGGYEASLSFNGPMEGEHVVEAAAEALRKLRALR